ncbi:DUF3460 family protein [Chitiniphilus eburneus]|uniref:DUF3460 family protein n=1 Tax=Chitiniphilus eburneus TaxID=2571148 RepID=A0A4U0PY51_9NEIS|nr:DUF3460 family protein [Chitiniphilus eburneus]TJZ73499.1 DUF3460 family protein [Chitiniphilus eburneus]
MFKNTTYVSEFTQFMRGYLNEHPDVARGQVEGRALLWDKSPINLEERDRNLQSRIEQKPYPYQPE